eukprot:10554341-Alexandrium_andersonii.AAC.1
MQNRHALLHAPAPAEGPPKSWIGAQDGPRTTGGEDSLQDVAARASNAAPALLSLHAQQQPAKGGSQLRLEAEGDGNPAEMQLSLIHI